MPRVKLLQDREDVAPEYHGLYEELAALRGRVSGPSSIVLHSPALAGPWNEISEFLHRETVVDPADAELAVCVTAREYDCGYIWASHASTARSAGVADAALLVVRDHGALDGLRSREAQIIRYVQQLLRSNRVDADLFEALLAAHDARWLIELTAFAGRYAALAGILNAFELHAAPDREQLPVDLDRPVVVPKQARAYGAAPRVMPITSRQQLGEADRPIFDEIAASRGVVRGPYSVLLYSPPLCKRVFDVSDYMLGRTCIEPRLRELATLAVAREKDCPYVWGAHAGTARDAGLSGQATEVVARRGETGALPEVERDVVDYVRAVLRAHRVEEALFQRMQQRHGDVWLVELTALIGHYGLIAAALNACEVGAAPDAAALPLA